MMVGQEAFPTENSLPACFKLREDYVVFGFFIVYNVHRTN